jgi:Cobalamin-5-phosphate synthase
MAAAALALLSGYGADRLLGDPARFHPAAGFGRIGTTLERRLWRPIASLASCTPNPLTHGSRGRAATAAVFGAGIAVALAGAHGAIAAGVAAAVVASLAVCYRRWLGGVTGDTLGAAVELTELAVFLTAVGLMGIQ